MKRALLSFTALLAFSAAHAQEQKPADAPVQTQQSVEPLPSEVQNSAPPQVEQQQLQQLDPWSVSALSRADGALAPDLWSGTDAATLTTLFDRLPATYESPAAQMLALRVLLSGGAPPQGDATAAVRKRFEALGKMGDANDLANMAAGSGAGLSDTVIAQYAAQAELARGRRVEACARGRSATSDTPPPFLLRLRAYCAAVGGDRAAAALALDLARTPHSTDDAWYSAAISAASGAPGRRPPPARYDNSLTAQISLAGNLRPSANPLAGASNLALVALARADNAPQPVRAQAAALAFRRGLLSPADARTVLRATPADVTTGLPAIAIALRQVEASPGSLDAASAIAGVLRQSSAPADFGSVARFFHGDIAALTQAPDAASAVLFARAAVAAGDVNLAQRLGERAQAAGADPVALAPLEVVLVAASGASGDAARNALHHRVQFATAPAARAVSRDIAILAALGVDLDPQLQAALAANPPQGGAAADATLMNALHVAVQRHSLGEAGLLAVLASGSGPARLDAASLSGILQALRAAGLNDDARHFAVEALLAGQPS